MRYYNLTDSFCEELLLKSTQTDTLRVIKEKYLALFKYYQESSQKFLASNKEVSSSIVLSKGILYLISHGWVMRYLSAKDTYEISYMDGRKYSSVNMIDLNDEDEKSIFNKLGEKPRRGIFIEDYLGNDTNIQFLDKIISERSRVGNSYLGVVVKDKTLFLIRLVCK